VAALCVESPDATPRRFERAALAALLLLYAGVCSFQLGVVPPAYEDEPWQASTGWKIATHGVFGSDMLAGFHGMEDHYYAFLPLHPLLLAASFRLLGLGLWQARTETAVLGMIVLLLTYALARRLFGVRVGLLAVAFLLCVRLVGATRYLITGIPFIDLARIARYDMAVPVFGLASLHLYLTARRRGVGLHFITGMVAGLAGLAHLYGVGWILALLMLARWDGRGRRVAAAMALGCAAVWAPYLAYVLAHPADWIGQTRGYTPRFDLFHLDWYAQNLAREVHRYGPGLGPPGWSYLARPGLWATSLLLPLGMIAMLRRAFSPDGDGARAVVVPSLLFVGAFALLVDSKVVSYTLTLLPLGAIAFAWAVCQLLDRGLLRRALPAVLVAIACEGALRLARLDAMARVTTPYSEFVGHLRARVAKGERVLGLHNYWLGFSDLDYRAWAVPLWKSNPAVTSSPLGVAQALDAEAPDMVLIDSRMRAFLDTDRRGVAIRHWMASRGYAAVARVDDATYGAVTLYRRAR
jgi:4-amino-4-deoxy-L-arabinose transferase-like glycosyltransferase